MKIFFVVFGLLVLGCMAVFSATTGLTIQGGQLTINDGYLAVGSTFTVVNVTPTGTTGQCMGMLCGITYPN